MSWSNQNRLKGRNDLPVILDPMSRRMFLRGLGSALAIPFLPSLAETAFAQATPAADPRFVFMNVTHGLNPALWTPLNATPTQVAPNVKAQRLSTIPNGVGYLIENRFNDILSKMNMIEGLDAIGPSDHYWFPWSASTSAGLGSSRQLKSPKFHYSIDEILAKSPLIYPNGSRIPVLRIDPGEALHTYSFQGPDVDGFAKVAGAEGATIDSVWQSIQSTLNPTTNATAAAKVAATRAYLVDRFLDEAKQLTAKNSLSSDDKRLMQNFTDQIFEVQKRISNPAVTTNSCASPTLTATSDNVLFNKRLMDIMVVAMSCGVTKIGTYHLNWARCMHPTDNLGNRYQPSVHDTIHHFADASGFTAHMLYWRTALDHYGYMVRQMSQANLLDQSVIVFTSDFASSTRGHHGIDLPVLTAGSLGGKLTTGELIRYHTQGIGDFRGGYTPAGVKTQPFKVGRRYNEFLVTILKAAGLQPADYQRQGITGFGTYSCDLGNTCAGGEGGLNAKVLSYQASADYPNSDPNAPLPYFYKG